jgi:hypothetical protein
MIDLPYHLYVRIFAGVISNTVERGAMFAMQPNLGGIFGAHVLLECGAIYRNVPINTLQIDSPDYCDSPPHVPTDAQVWDCYATEYRAIEYSYLRGLATKIKTSHGGVVGRYLFTLIPQGDAFSRHLDQAKEFMVSHCCTTGHIYVRPTDKILFVDPSIPTTEATEWPKHLKRQEGVMPSCEK